VGEYDAAKILHLIQVDKAALFPYLRGSKLANYWLFILGNFTDAQFSNMNYISIIPDTHVLQSSVRLGLSNEKDTPEQVAIIWRELLKDSDLNPVEMHPVLWNWSRNGFEPSV
jgi:hypothetical protein